MGERERVEEALRHWVGVGEEEPPAREALGAPLALAAPLVLGVKEGEAEAQALPVMLWLLLALGEVLGLPVLLLVAGMLEAMAE